MTEIEWIFCACLVENTLGKIYCLQMIQQQTFFPLLILAKCASEKVPGTKWEKACNTINMNDHCSAFIPNLEFEIPQSKVKSFSYPCLKSKFKGQEKWSSVRITDSKKNSMKVENHVSIHSNLNLNGLDQKGIGKEVKIV